MKPKTKTSYFEEYTAFKQDLELKLAGMVTDGQIDPIVKKNPGAWVSLRKQNGLH